MWPKLDELLVKYQSLEQQMADPAIIADGGRYSKIAREFGTLTKQARPYLDFKKISADLAALIGSRDAESDPEMRQLIEEEIATLSARKDAIQKKIEDMLLVDPEEDFDNVILEVRAGVGGDEAALFAGDLYRMYTRFAEDQGWKVETLDFNATDKGGFKEISCSISGEGAYRLLRYESGGHRVQRVPETEAQGRIHTSAVTVAVMPEPTEVQIEIKPEDVRIDTFCTGGPGGQHQNKTQSGVRLTHLPTGTVAESRTERSQHKNKDICWRMLRTRIYEALAEKERIKRAAERKSQIGSGDRSERIRTYNFPQNRLTDHRINLNLYHLDTIIAGNLGPVVRALMDYDKQLRLAEMQGPTKKAS